MQARCLRRRGPDGACEHSFYYVWGLRPGFLLVRLVGVAVRLRRPFRALVETVLVEDQRSDLPAAVADERELGVDDL